MDLHDAPPPLPTAPAADYRVLLFPQALVGFIDAVSLMIVLPSLIFYVQRAGGTKEQYGVVCSAFALASFAFKPVLGYWSDAAGNKFRAPYLTSMAVAAVGALLYFLASMFEGRTALKFLLLGRLLGGCGAANNSLGYTYVARVVPQEQMTRASSILSMVRIFGMSVAPGLNALLSKANLELPFGPWSLVITPLNVVGLVMLFGNLLGFLIMYLMLLEPDETPVTPPNHPKTSEQGEEEGGGLTSLRFWRNLCRPDTLVPILAYFTLNFNFQFMETGLAPAASDALGWGTVAISTVFGIDAVLIFFVYILTFELSALGMGDVALMKTGLFCSVGGYTMMYLWWRQGTLAWMFVLPIVVCTAAFPFLGSPIRSIFCFAVSQNEALSPHQGTLQAMLSMTSSVAGFTAPTFIASFVLRTHDEAAASGDHRVLGALALVAPALSVVTLVCLTMVQDRYDYERKEWMSDSSGEDCCPNHRLPSEERLPLIRRLTPPDRCDSSPSTSTLGVEEVLLSPNTCEQV